MEKRRLLLVILFFAFIILINLVFVQAGIHTTKSTGLRTGSFTNSDKIYLKGDRGLCNSVYESANIYVVEKDKIDVLNDVRGDFQEINLTSSFAISSNTLIWENPAVGDYDVVLDCDKDGQYHSLEPMTSFKVSAEKGSVSVSIGEKDRGNHSWQYDPEEVDLVDEIMQIKLIAKSENVKLENITLSFLGNYSELEKIEIYEDSNNNGILDESEDMGGGEINKSTLTLELDYILEKDEIENILFVLIMKETAEGDYSLKINSVYGMGEISEELVKALGLPITSGIKKVLPKKTCVGTLVLELEPELAIKNSKVIAKISGLSGCENETVSLRRNSCDSVVIGEIGSCILGTECQMNFTANENRNYYLCIDKNRDGDYEDFGESDSADLVVIEKPVEEEEVSNFTGNKTEEGVADRITGEVVGGAERLNITIPTFLLVLLEITLLLILIVLVIISYRLRSRKSGLEAEEESEEPEEKKKKK